MSAADLDKRLDAIDASVFSGELLWDDEQRRLLKEYSERWLLAVTEHEAFIATNGAA